jgi:hypothetical protein
MTIVLTPKGRGRWSRIRITWNERWRSELPNGVEIRVGDDWPMAGTVYRVAEVWP